MRSKFLLMCDRGELIQVNMIESLRSQWEKILELPDISEEFLQSMLLYNGLIVEKDVIVNDSFDPMNGGGVKGEGYIESISVCLDEPVIDVKFRGHFHGSYPSGTLIEVSQLIQLIGREQSRLWRFGGKLHRLVHADVKDLYVSVIFQRIE